MRRKSFENVDCPIARSLDVIGDWWSLLILRDAFAGRRRFGEFHRSLGLARNILAARLKKLVARGILEMAPASDGTTYQEYVLTEKGRGLLVVLLALRQWGGEHLLDGEDQDRTVVDAQSGEPLAPLTVVASDGRVLRPEDVRFERPGEEVQRRKRSRRTRTAGV